MRGFLLPHAFAFYGGVLKLADDHDRLAAVAGYILAHQKQRIDQPRCAAWRRTMRKLDAARHRGVFEQLDALGWVTRTPGPRPTDPPHWIVNPVVHRKFAERGRAEAERRKRERDNCRRNAAEGHGPIIQLLVAGHHHCHHCPSRVRIRRKRWSFSFFLPSRAREGQWVTMTRHWGEADGYGCLRQKTDWRAWQIFQELCLVVAAARPLLPSGSARTSRAPAGIGTRTTAAALMQTARSRWPRLCRKRSVPTGLTPTCGNTHPSRR